ncbi:hypothetical protein BB560_006797 [Smittium megazygosporum]|uniref:Threonine/serine exporter-like N-terminal domain-containing protein n=1 Tax=Smittium megazygosporum TaxID=133381 RepID=A0A2T9Y1F5_9FUNG|nr:hypothetical protein BB560_006797 [Smittium megazygosporum]
MDADRNSSIDLGNSNYKHKSRVPKAGFPQHAVQSTDSQTELHCKVAKLNDADLPEISNTSSSASEIQQGEPEKVGPDSKNKHHIFKLNHHKKEKSTSKFERIGGTKLVDKYEKKMNSPTAPSSLRNSMILEEEKDIEKELEDVVMPMFMQILSKSRRASPNHSSNNSVYNNSSLNRLIGEKSQSTSKDPLGSRSPVKFSGVNSANIASSQNESGRRYYVNKTNLKEAALDHCIDMGVNNDPHFQSELQIPDDKTVDNERVNRIPKEQSTDTSRYRKNNLLPLFSETYPQESLEKIQEIIQFREFLIKIAQFLGSYGCPLYRLEENLDRLSKYSGIEASFAALPGFILVFFTGSKGNYSQTKIVKMSSDYNIQKLELVDALLEDVLTGKLPVETGLLKLSTIKSLPMVYPWYFMMFGYCLSSMAISTVAFNGGFKEAGVSFLLGLFEYIFFALSNKVPSLQNLVEMISAFLVGFCAAALSKYVCFASVVLASLVNLLPGMTMTTGFIELLAKSFITGTIKIFYALTIIFVLTYGIQLGQLSFSAIKSGNIGSGVELDTSSCTPLSKYWIILFFPILTLSFCIYFNVPKKRVPLCVAISVIMYGTFFLLDHFLHVQQISTIASSFVLGVSCNIIDRFFGIPPFVFLLTCTLILVPGSVGVQGATAIFTGSSSSELISRMLMSCFSIATGLFLATLVTYPMGKKRSALLSF